MPCEAPKLNFFHSLTRAKYAHTDAARQKRRPRGIDAELTVCGDDGVPQFHRLQGELCVWAFDLLKLDGDDLRQESLEARKAALMKLLRRASPFLRASESFSDPVKLLAECERRGLEGVVSKRADSQYRSGRSSAWIKTKCPRWREANRDRHELFERA